jgi:transcriptional regulator GlxA family with amidase domain
MFVRDTSLALRQSFGSSPALFVEKLRLGEARSLLGERGSRVDQVASAVGFATNDAFRSGLREATWLIAQRGRFEQNKHSR